MAFALAVLRILAAERGHIEPALEVKGLGRAACVFVANTHPYTYAKGVPLPIAPAAEFELGLDMVAPVRIRRRSLVRTAWSLLRGRPRDGVLYAHDADRIEIVCDAPMPLQVDGEDLGDVGEAVFEVERRAVAVLV
jgi:diacylglycerol kinase family enzyme